jgi:hypothetical protein
MNDATRLKISSKVPLRELPIPEDEFTNLFR